MEKQPGSKFKNTKVSPISKNNAGQTEGSSNQIGFDECLIGAKWVRKSSANTKGKEKKEMFPNFFVPKQKKKFVTVIKSEAGIFADLESHC